MIFLDKRNMEIIVTDGNRIHLGDLLKQISSESVMLSELSR